jgi:hypothetical protein
MNTEERMQSFIERTKEAAKLIDEATTLAENAMKIIRALNYEHIIQYDFTEVNYEEYEAAILSVSNIYDELGRAIHHLEYSC